MPEPLPPAKPDAEIAPIPAATPTDPSAAVIPFQCPNCLTRHAAEPAQAGLPISCPTCGVDLRIPGDPTNS